MINATPNLNGNTDEDFHNAAQKLHDAAMCVEAALITVRTHVLHSRNYQTLLNPHDARREDLEVVQQVEQDTKKMKALAVAIYHQIKEV